MKSKSIDDLYAEFESLEDQLQAAERAEMEETLGSLPSAEREELLEQFKRIDYMCKEFLGS